MELGGDAASRVGDETLTYTSDLSVGPDGRVYVLQTWDPVVVFLPDGTRAGTIGRAGEGPGEFSDSPDRVGWRGDRLWVSHRFATQFLTAAGEEMDRVSFRMSVPEEGSRLSPGTPLPDGTFLPYRTVTENSGRLFRANRIPLRRVSAVGEIVDTIAIVERHLAPYTIERERGRDGWGVRIEHPLGPWAGESWLPVAIMPDGSAVVFVGEVRAGRAAASFDLLRLRFDGDTLLRRSIRYERRPITREEEAAQREAFGASLAGDNIPESMRPPWDAGDPERKRRIGYDLIAFPAHHPPVRRIVAGDDGSMWLLREAWPSPADVWEVYGVEGELEGTVRIEGRSDHASWGPRLRILRANREEVWGTTLGEFDVPYIHRYRVDRTCR